MIIHIRLKYFLLFFCICNSYSQAMDQQTPQKPSPNPEQLQFMKHLNEELIAARTLMLQQRQEKLVAQAHLEWRDNTTTSENGIITIHNGYLPYRLRPKTDEDTITKIKKMTTSNRELFSDSTDPDNFCIKRSSRTLSIASQHQNQLEITSQRTTVNNNEKENKSFARYNGPLDISNPKIIALLAQAKQLGNALVDNNNPLSTYGFRCHDFKLYLNNDGSTRYDGNDAPAKEIQKLFVPLMSALIQLPEQKPILQKINQ